MVIIAQKLTMDLDLNVFGNCFGGEGGLLGTCAGGGGLEGMGVGGGGEEGEGGDGGVGGGGGEGGERTGREDEILSRVFVGGDRQGGVGWGGGGGRGGSAPNSPTHNPLFRRHSSGGFASSASLDAGGSGGREGGGSRRNTDESEGGGRRRRSLPRPARRQWRTVRRGLCSSTRRSRRGRLLSLVFLGRVGRVRELCGVMRGRGRKS